MLPRISQLRPTIRIALAFGLVLVAIGVAPGSASGHASSFCGHYSPLSNGKWILTYQGHNNAGSYHYHTYRHTNRSTGYRHTAVHRCGRSTTPARSDRAVWERVTELASSVYAVLASLPIARS